MLSRFKNTGLALLGLGALLGCSYDIDKTGGLRGTFAGPGASPDFNSVFQGVIRPKCATCHSAAQGNRGGVNLETYENVFANRSAVQFAVQGGFMPPRSAGGLTAEEKSFLLAWLSAGAPREAAPGPPGPNPVPPSPSPTPPPGNGCDKKHGDDDEDDCFDSRDPAAGPVTFAMVFEQVLAPRCVSCHGERGGVNLETYDNVFANRQAIVDAVEGGFMPPPPRGPLTPEQKELLMRWMQSGAPFTNP